MCPNFRRLRIRQRDWCWKINQRCKNNSNLWGNFWNSGKSHCKISVERRLIMLHKQNIDWNKLGFNATNSGTYFKYEWVILVVSSCWVTLLTLSSFDRDSISHINPPSFQFWKLFWYLPLPPLYLIGIWSVSYTHLTLPTIYSV